MTLPDLDHRSSQRRWLPATAGAAVLILLTGAIAWPRLTADAATTPTAPPLQAVIVATPATSTSSRTCRVPQPLTVAQIAALGNQPTQPPAALSAPSPAPPHLRRVIQNLTDAACDSQKGRYAHTQIRQWATNMSSSGGVTTLDVQVWQYQRWRATDNSGRLLTITAPTEGPARTDTTYRRGEIDEPLTRLPTDPGLLWAQFDRIQPEENGPQSALRAWSDLNAWFSPNRAQRTAALTVFHDTDALTWHGTAQDRAGRPGIGLSVTSDNGGTRDLLILDPRTGELLAYELTALRDPGALGITEPTVLGYHLFLAHTRTAATRQP